MLLENQNVLPREIVVIFFLILLVSTEMFVFLGPIGVILAFVFYENFIGPVNLSALGYEVLAPA